MLKYHIQTIEVGAAGAGSIVFNGIPQDYDDLYLVVSPVTSSATNFWMRFNSSAANYSFRRLVVSLGDVDSYTQGDYGNAQNVFIGESWSGSALIPSSISVTIPSYSKPTAKSVSVDHVSEANAGTTSIISGITSGLWNDTSPVTSISLVGQNASFAQHSSASLYGIKRGSSGEVEVASGGAVSYSGGYTIHTFNTSGTFVANRDLDVEYLVVGGGGGGGQHLSGGAGAGGYRSSVVGESSGGGVSAEPKLRVGSGESFAVVVGAGGAGTAGISGASGASSSFASITSLGGGFAGNVTVGGNGGSGGANGSVNTSGSGTGTAGQGFDAGQGSGGFEPNRRAGGGGGAGGAGSSGSANGNGGNGVSSSITGTAITRAGGGGGGCDYNGGLTPGSGGTGGGGAGGKTGPGGNGTIYTGSGGGGGGYSGSAQQTGGNGGSGIVIIRYLTPA